ncbi:MAG: hypothetical protein J4F50_06400 [Acidimicrobiia bacterium]|nr:hypothetical protein [Acidimicrobiia bacterium]
MTLIVLTVLATAWLGYFALWFRHRRASRPLRGDGVVDSNQYFDRSVAASTSERVSFASVGGGARNLGDLLDSPRTRQQALRRRRHVATVLIAVALASLLAVPVFGPTALAVHVMVDVVLILFAFGSVHRQQPLPVNVADVRVLYPDRPAPSDAVAMPLRRVANG